MHDKQLPSLSLASALNEFRSSFFHIGFFSMFVNFSMLAMPAYMMAVFDRVLISGSIDTLIFLTMILVLVFTTMWLLEFVRGKMMVRIVARLDQKVRRAVFDSMFQSGLSKGGHGSAQALSDLYAVQQFMMSKAVFAFFDLPWLPIFIFVLFIMHPWYGWMAVFSAFVMVIITLLTEQMTKRPLTEAMEHNGIASRTVQDQLKNAEIVHALGMQEHMRERWEKHHKLTFISQAKSKDADALLGTAGRTLRILLQSLVMGLGALLVITNEATAGMMIAASFILGRALYPLDMLTGAWQAFTPAKKSWTNLNELLRSYPEESQRMSLPQPTGNVDVHQLFAGPPSASKATLEDISLSLSAGEVMMVAGPSASGKSTFARVLLGIWPTISGVVRLDGADITKWDRKELGKYLGYLPQDIELFNGTIAENISRFGEVDPEKVVVAAKTAGIHDMLLALPEGYDTYIGSGGIALSGGQRQRLGLARALYNNPVLVVLDEPNSNLDDAGEQALVQAIQRLKQQKTTVVLISHKMNILNQADKVLILQSGKISFFGSRDAVIQRLQAEKQKAGKLKSVDKTRKAVGS